MDTKVGMRMSKKKGAGKIDSINLKALMQGSIVAIVTPKGVLLPAKCHASATHESI